MEGDDRPYLSCEDSVENKEVLGLGANGSYALVRVKRVIA